MSTFTTHQALSLPLCRSRRRIAERCRGMVTRHVAVFPATSSRLCSMADRYGTAEKPASSDRIKRLRSSLTVHSRVGHPFVSRSIRAARSIFPSLPVSLYLSFSLYHPCTYTAGTMCASHINQLTVLVVAADCNR
ncbi:hypothetical protein PUN28_008720 [Cardiocondyla obscurior]|uniref:Uncharacterized protein n=1 Tax=Cardiocondyla obscurior TaxID=286306 RepID=A0AAW2G2E7_9HYME